MATFTFVPTGHAILTNDAKQMVAMSMYDKGKSFLGAAILLRQKDGYEYVVLHLICQGIEIVLKALLLLIDYDQYKPKLQKPLGHNLVKIVNTVIAVSGAKPLKSHLLAELETLNTLYSRHLLRYGSPHDILVNSATISSSLVLRRFCVLVRLLERNEIFKSPAPAITQQTLPPVPAGL